MHTVKLSKKEIEGVFKVYKEPKHIVLALYKKVIPNWFKVERVGHFPECNRKTADFICKELCNIDRLAGMLWVNNGWSVNSDLKDWEVAVYEEKIQYKVSVFEEVR